MSDKQPSNNLLLWGEPPRGSSPLVTLARALRRYDCHCELAEQTDYSNDDWRNLSKGRDAIVVLTYHGPKRRAAFFLAAAAARGTAIIRWWVGSDVLNCLDSEKDREAASTFDQIVNLNIAVAPHLVTELQSIGIESRFIPSVLAEDPHAIAVATGGEAVPQSVLVYLPTPRSEFYGRGVVQQAIEDNPDLEFVIVADESHALRDFPNVRSLGWVENMEEIWPTVGAVLRITQHDGLPRMVLDALLRGKYVIYSWPLEGCWYAKHVDEVQQRLDEFKLARTANDRGRDAMLGSLSPDPAKQYSKLVKEATDQTGLRSRLRAIRLAWKYRRGRVPRN